tara:strand:+ start:226 stop:1512 length:1287 start_codon:yes stop_codon:yes gene_type:complete
MKKGLLLLLVLSIFGLSINAQNHKCGTMNDWGRIKTKDSNAEQRMQQLEIKTQKWIQESRGQRKAAYTVITIPVVVHVLYNTIVENISDAQIFSQIDGLNEDFRLLNADSLKPSHPFWFDAADCLIEFCLAQQDPNGNATTGITRTFTDSTGFVGIGNEKFTATGGKDNWDPTKYMNLWVCNLDGSAGTLGYAAFPSNLASYPSDDGVVIDFKAFGYVGTAGTPPFDVNDLGRTGTHEVGHWLNLRHIWGDAMCGDDFCADTPQQEGKNYECPTYPRRPNNTCGTGTDGEMYMNYMDYVDDVCMVMFSFDQSARMDAALFNTRSGLLTSEGCSIPTGIASLKNQSITVNLYPNPSKGYLFLDIRSNILADIDITIHNILGEIIYQNNKQNIITLDNFRIDIKNESNGIYFVNITTDNYKINKKIIINK